jgi:hypothetical protein
MLIADILPLSTFVQFGKPPKEFVVMDFFAVKDAIHSVGLLIGF